MAFSKVKAGGLADNSVGSSQISPDTVVASDIAANAVTASELADNAVDTDAIAASAVVTAKIADSTGASDGITTAKLATNAVTTAKITDANITAAKLNTDVTDGSAITTEVKPHIIPDVLYPSYVASGTSNKLLDGTTNHSGAFGTTQSDGRKYYYTNIKGSKPIKDPRIGGHFGSQRYRFSSFQILEQETATHGSNVHSVDGRDWIRRVGNLWEDVYGTSGTWVYASHNATENSQFIEIIGYFNAANWLTLSDTNNDVNLSIDGTANSSTFTGGTTNVSSPLSDRYVNPTVVVPLIFDSTPTLGIHTLKLSNENGDYMRTYGIELIAQDLSGSGSPNRSKIKFHAQNVVSFGKKFEITETNHHYDPFSAKTDGSAWTSPTSGNNTANSAASWPTNIDTAHSLGLDKWVDGSSYYRPYNGGRVVKYVDSTGTIKTAVTVMPPNAKSIKSADVNKKAKNAGNTTYLPTFEDETTDINEDELHEVAKTFHFREFGNGAQNGGAGASGTKADASMLKDAADHIAYVMDDGLTSLVGKQALVHDSTSAGLALNAVNDFLFLTFIGTGFSLRQIRTANTPNDQFTITVDGVQVKTGQVFSGTDEFHIVQNLPYGTHVVKLHKTFSNYITHMTEFTFYQPKRPPTPEDALVLADYMLYADWVPIGDAETGYISKGARRTHASRDVLVNKDSGSNSPSFAMAVSDDNGSANFGFRVSPGSGSPCSIDLPVFSTNFAVYAEDPSVSGHAMSFGGTSSTITKLDNSANDDLDAFVGPTTSTDLGVNKLEYTAMGDYHFSGFDSAGIIHTSHHYQTFESPYLHELVGGDRNMEQTNLVCSSDGKTWDEVTRDTSYVSKILVSARVDIGTGYLFDSAVTQWDEWRGIQDNLPCQNKDWAIAFDRIICLKDGEYTIAAHILHGNGASNQLRINGTAIAYIHNTGTNDSGDLIVSYNFKRGDYVQTYHQVYEGVWSHIQILKK